MLWMIYVNLQSTLESVGFHGLGNRKHGFRALLLVVVALTWNKEHDLFCVQTPTEEMVSLG